MIHRLWGSNRKGTGLIKMGETGDVTWRMEAIEMSRGVGRYPGGNPGHEQGLRGENEFEKSEGTEGRAVQPGRCGEKPGKEKSLEKELWRLYWQGFSKQFPRLSCPPEPPIL